MSNPLKITILPAKQADIPSLIPLLLSLYSDDNPEVPAPSKASVEDHCRLLLKPTTPHRLIIAWRESRAIGLAAIASFVSISDPRAAHRKQVELKELFVMPQARGQGVGEALMEWVIAEAVRQGACRIDWHVKRNNHRGIEFYERFEGRIVESRLSMRKVLSGLE